MNTTISREPGLAASSADVGPSARQRISIATAALFASLAAAVVRQRDHLTQMAATSEGTTHRNAGGVIIIGRADPVLHRKKHRGQVIGHREVPVLRGVDRATFKAMQRGAR